tara:strand:+ start:409 stop:648 length:240 start_codon:yes stop_codon:yes gene_type:complete
MTNMRDKIAGIIWHDRAGHNTVDSVADAIMELVQARIDELEEALGDMVDLFSADDMLLKGTHLHATLKQARATPKGTNK